MITAFGFDGDPISTVNNYFQKIIERTVKAINSRNLTIGTLNIMMLGDMVEGWKVFPKQLTIQVRPQMDIIVKNMLQMIEYFAGQDNIQQVDVYGVFGNHGRVSFRHSTTDNWDQIAYDRIQERIDMYKQFGHGNYHKVNGYITDDEIEIAQIGNFRYAFTHGDQIGGLSDGRLKGLMHDIQFTVGLHDAMLLGHWHCMRWDIYNGIHIVVNGCTYDSEYNKYRIVKKADIVQILFGASDDEAVSWLERIKCE